MPDRRRAGRSTLPDQRTLLSWLFVGPAGAGRRHPARRRAGLDRAAPGVVPRHRRRRHRPAVHGLRRVAGVPPAAASRATASCWCRRWWTSASLRRSSTSRASRSRPSRRSTCWPWRPTRCSCRPPGARSPRSSRRRSSWATRSWTRAGAPDTAFWAQVVVFNVVFAIVAVLGHRLREAGMEQETLAIELKRVRLEADDILRNIRSGVLTVDGVGRLAFINPTGQKLLDLDGEGLIGMPVLDQLKTRSSELWAAVVAGIRNGRKISRGEGMVTHQGGRIFPIGLSTTTFRQETQEAPSVTAIFTDISDLKEVQELQARAERLESVAALERLAGARDPEPAGLDPELGRAARPLQARRRGRALPGRPHRPGERPAEPAPERVPRFRPGARHPARAARPPRGGGGGGPADPGAPRLPPRRGAHGRGRRAPCWTATRTCCTGSSPTWCSTRCRRPGGRSGSR